MYPLPSLRQLHYFIAVAGALSFVRAAESCYVTQSTLSGGVRDLESLLGGALFERTSRSVTLTPLGQSLLPLALDIVLRGEVLVQRAQQDAAPLSGPLVLGVIPTIAPYLLPDLLPVLQREYPNLQLNLREDLTARLLEGLRKGDIDVGLIAFPFATPDMDSTILWEEPFYAVSAQKGRTPARPIKIEELAGQEILLLDDGHCLRDHAIAACHLSPSATRKTFGATSLPTLIQMVHHGYGMTLLPAMVVSGVVSGMASGAPPGGLCVRRFANPQPSRKIGLVWRKNSPRAAEFALLGKLIVKSRKGL